MTVQYTDLRIEWQGYATVRLAAGDTVAYLDPGRYGVLTGEWEPDSEDAANAHPGGDARRPEDGDLVCLTHVHHYDPDGIDRVASEDATIVAFEGINPRDSRRDVDRLVDLPYETVVQTGNSDRRDAEGSNGDGRAGADGDGNGRLGADGDGNGSLGTDVPLWTVPAYNEPGGPRTTADGRPIHPEGFGCGFVLSIAGTRVCWPGDTDVLDGHAALDVDVLLPPIGGAFTMDREDAAALAAEMEPGLVVPVHYNTFEALATDSRAFAADVAARGVPVALDEA
jgi:L-ascorbate metabolism protein UlaG (beta-lactamase superfamily)